MSLFEEEGEKNLYMWGYRSKYKCVVDCMTKLERRGSVQDARTADGRRSLGDSNFREKFDCCDA